MDQEDASAARGVNTIRKAGQAMLPRHPLPLVLHLPNHPTGSENPPHPQGLGWIAAVAMPHSIHERFLKTELEFRQGLASGDRL
jgi:hypothetical protein